jgi:glycosyltransferase involved in cell wall biosynthesis
MTRVLLDVTSLRTAHAGVRRYVEGLQALLMALEPDVTTVRRAAPVPGYSRTESPVRKAWRHIMLLVWYQVVLPWHAWRAHADVIICPEYYCPWLAPCPRAVVFYDTMFWDRPEYARWWRALLRMNALLPARRANAVITLSAAVRPRLAELLARDPKEIELLTIVVEPGPDGTGPEDTDAAPETQLIRLGLEPGYLLHVGALEKRKRLPHLLRSYAMAQRSGTRLPRLVLAGPRSPIKSLDDGDAIDDTIKAEDLGDDVVLAGMVPNDLMGALFRGALALVFVSEAEGFGIPLAEAMAAGLPVVGTRSSTTCEVTGEAALLVEPGDVQALAGALIQVTRDPELRRNLAAAGLEQARRFSLSAVKGEFSSILNRLAG